MPTEAKRITSTLSADGKLTVQVEDFTLPDPKGTQIVVAIEAAPINPSDLGLLLGPADLDAATYSPGKLVAPMPAAAMKAFKGRIGDVCPVGNEGAGTVVAAGPDAQHLMGKKVTIVPGSAFATHAIGDASMAIQWPDDVNIANASAAFVNPMTALGFVETARMEGHKAIIHAAAASNLGQMLNKICQADGMGLVNIVRREKQARLLKDLGAEHVVNSSDDDFMKQLVGAIDATGAMLGFDPTGGGTMANTMLTAMEAVCAKNEAYSRYGSMTPKKVYVYGILDLSPRVMTHSYGFSWTLSGWLLTPFLMQAGAEVVGRMRQRVIDEIDTTFASHFKQEITLEEMLQEDIANAYNAKATGEKYLVTP
ncbi:MAG: zinc-binding dehydrogenase [Sphingomonadaceae bacterium]|nr:zinc-binding dehydrogenase [Sphingomonadaceae bacterium]